MLQFKATPLSIVETVLIFEGDSSGKFPEREEIVFTTDALKPKHRGGAALQDIPRDPADYIYEPINFLFGLLYVDTQYKVFKAYKEIYDTISSSNVKDVIRDIRDRVSDLFNILTLDLMSMGASRNSKIYIPELNSGQFSRSVVAKPYSGIGIVSETFSGTQDTAKYSEYNTEDYRGLVVLSLAARALFPVFGEMTLFLSESIAAKFRNEFIFKVIYGSWLHECAPMQKYRCYINFQVEQNPISKAFSAIMEGVSSIDLGEFIGAETFIKKVGTFDLYKADGNHDLIKSIYNFATGAMMKGLDKKFSGAVRGKTPPSERATLMGGDEDKSSVLENIFTRSDMRIGDRVASDHFTNYMPVESLLKEVLHRDVTEDDIKIYNMVRKTLTTFEPDPTTGKFRDSITANICSDFLSPAFNNYLEAEASYKIQAIAITKLLAHGFYDIAALAMATIDKENSEFITTNPTKLSKDNADTIYDLYRIWWPVRSANKGNSFFSNYVSTNQVAVLTDKRYNNPGSKQIQFWVTKILTKSYYRSKLHKSFLEKSEGYVNDGSSFNYQRPTNINNILAELVILIGKENQIQNVGV